MRKALLLLLATLCVTMTPALADEHGGDHAAAEALAERMLQAIGGRDNWAALRNTINGSQQNRAEGPAEIYSLITMDFERPRFRIETTAADLHLARVIDGDKSWRQDREGKIMDVEDDFYADEMRWYASHLYRTIHRVAARDPALRLAVGDDGRLEVWEGEQRLRWFELDAADMPYRSGTFDDDIGGLMGPWDYTQDGIRHPIWVSNPDGTWRASIQALATNVPLREHLFARPN